MKNLKKLQAFNVMDKFFQYYYWKKPSGEIACFLSEISFLSDGGTADPAAWPDWEKVTNKVKKNNDAFTPEEVFLLMIDFFKEYYSSFPDTYLEEVIGEKLFLTDKKTINPTLWKQWMEAVNKVLQEPIGTKRYVELRKP